MPEANQSAKLNFVVTNTRFRTNSYGAPIFTMLSVPKKSAIVR